MVSKSSSEKIIDMTDQYSRPEVFVCECGSLSHVYQLWYDEEEGDLHWYVTIRQYRSFLQRIWRALGYIVGKKARFGDYDGFIINPDDIKAIRRFLDKAEVNQLLTHNPEIAQSGIRCWGAEDKFARWLLSTTTFSKELCGGRVIDMSPEQILDEIGRIEHGVFF